MERNSMSIVPEDWDDSEKTDASDVNDADSDCNSSSQPIPLIRYTSLAELSTIATNCGTAKEILGEPSIREQWISLAPRADEDQNQITTQLNLNWSQSLLATPPKVVHTTASLTNPAGDEPLTPTANLKMLVSAASPAIRDREIKKRELFPGEESSAFETLQAAASLGLISNAKRSDSQGEDKIVDEQSSQMDGTLDKITVSRKDKSLGLLCQKFLSKYPEYPDKNQFIEIGLDEVAKDLNVERRRIYDIVNVLESVEVIRRYAKNRYVWHGKSRLPSTLVKLKHYAVTKGLKLSPTWISKELEKTEGSTIEVKKEKSQTKKTPLVLSNKLPMILPKDANFLAMMQNLTPSMCLDQNLMPPPAVMESNGEENTKKSKLRVDGEYCRKDKSLGVLSQKFLTMFLVSETRYVTLEDAANLLIGDEAEGKSKYKTKVRRLYDIANILSSLQLIEKVHIHSIQSGRKPGFRWIGIDPDKLEDLTTSDQDVGQDQSNGKRLCGCKGTTTLTEDDEESAIGRLISRRPSQQQMRVRSTEAVAASKTKMPRSRSEKVLGSKRKYVPDQRDSEEDGFSIYELTASFGVDPSAASPTEVKFRAELKKLHQQYPDRMSQLLSACRQSFPNDSDSRKSRRSLFLAPNMEPEDHALELKRRRSADDALLVKAEPEVRFSHSSTSPFKRFAGENNKATPSGSRQGSPNDKPSQTSPEQKILLERQKQQKLLEEQRDFDSQDERWKRIEFELEKAFPKAAHSRPTMVHESSQPLPHDSLVGQSSVAIQASLIDDLSPLKPLSYYRKSTSAWKSDSCSVSSAASASLSPVSLQSASVMSSFANPHALSPVPILPASERPTNFGNTNAAKGLLLQIPPSSSSSVVWATPTPPSGNSTPSPSHFIRVQPGHSVNTPALYSPRSLTPTPEPRHQELSENAVVVDKQKAVITASLIATPPGNVYRVEPSPILFAGGHQGIAGNCRIPVQQQTLSAQVPNAVLHVSNADILSLEPIARNTTSIQFSTPLSKVSADSNGAVCTETPTSTVQLLADVSKRLSLPLAHDHSS